MSFPPNLPLRCRPAAKTCFLWEALSDPPGNQPHAKRCFFGSRQEVSIFSGSFQFLYRSSSFPALHPGLQPSVWTWHLECEPRGPRRPSTAEPVITVRDPLSFPEWTAPGHTVPSLSHQLDTSSSRNDCANHDRRALPWPTLACKQWGMLPFVVCDFSLEIKSLSCCHWKSATETLAVAPRSLVHTQILAFTHTHPESVVHTLLPPYMISQRTAIVTLGSNSCY